MRPLILLVTVSIFVSACACDCPAQTRRTQPTYQQPGTYAVQPAFDPNKKVTGHHDAAGNLMYRHGQVIDFPTGMNRLHLTVLLDRNTWRTDPTQYKMAQWFTAGAKAKDGSPRSANARLRAVQDAVAFHYHFTDDPNFAETARIEVMGSGPCIALTGPDGKIKRDGGAGCFLGVNELANISGPDDVADLIIAAAEGFNEKPQIQGLIRRGVDTIGAGTFCQKCGVPTGGGECPNCTPRPQPNSGTVPSKIPAVVPQKRSSITGGVIVLSLLGITAAGATAVGVLKPFNRKATP